MENGLRSERQEIFDLLRQVARLTFAVNDLALVLSLAVMAAETVLESPRAEIRSFWIVWIPWFRVGRHVPSRHDNRIPLDRTVVYHARMTGGAPLSLAACVERFHMLPVAH